MEFKHMFRALVLSSGVSAAGCVGKNVSSTTGAAAAPAAVEEAAPAAVEEAAESLDGMACEEICDYGSEAICPDPESGSEGCCWLMMSPHPCCDFDPSLEEPSEGPR